ncbi:MAG: transglycosylase family protein [Microgenomates group bacterium]
MGTWIQQLFSHITRVFTTGALIIGIITPTPTPTPLPMPTPTAIPTQKPTATPTQKPTATPSPTPKPTPIPVTAAQLDEWFTKYSNHYSIDRQKFWNIAVCESGLRPSATNGIYGGLFQFSPATWKSTRAAMQMDTNPDLRFNAEEAIKTAAFKTSTAGLAAWPNCGK